MLSIKMILISIVMFLFIDFCGAKFRNNVCKTFEDYNFMDTSPNCYYHPDVDIEDAAQLIYKNIGAVEKYTEVTTDGYIVTAYRLPRQNPKGVILLWHPLTVDAMVWIASGNTSLAFLLWNAGYDVWMPSNRGTFLSPGHVSMDSTDYEFSNFSFHEIGTIDTSLWVRLIGEKTQRNDIVFIGHSMSCTTSLIYASMLPDEAKKYIKVFIIMAPPYRHRHVTNRFMKISADFAPIIKNISESIRLGGIYRSPILDLIRPMVLQYPQNRLLTLVIDFWTGWSPDEFDPELMALLVMRIPRGIPMKALYHYHQQYLTGKFQQYDYGRDRNMQLYGQESPPDYPVGKIQVPFYIICSDNDDMTTSKDCDVLYRDLPERARYGLHKLKGFSHVDYHTSKRRLNELFYPLLDFVDKLFN